MVGQDYIELGTLTLEELTGVVNLYPWYGAAHKELCRRMAEAGGEDWGERQYAREALYVADRGKLAPFLRQGRKTDCSDKDVQEILRSFIATEAPENEESADSSHSVHVVGGDYFSQAQYDRVKRGGDNIFSRFAAAPERSPGEHESSDIADRFATETLAAIFAEQGCIEEARRIYSRLILDNPEKSAYFASLIDKLD